MEFQKRIKGKLTETLVSELLEHAGYKVVPLGIEQIIREVKDVESKTSNLPKQLRTLPDFLVTDSQIQHSWLVEVKYRHEWDKKTIAHIEKTLTAQVRHWEEVYCLIFLGNCKGKTVTPAARSGVFKLVLKEGKLAYVRNGKTYPWKQAQWSFSSRIHKIFPSLTAYTEKKTIHRCCEIVDKYSDILVS